VPELISVVIPTYNRPVQLGRCLAALAASDHPADRFEVVVVDDGGTIPLLPVVGSQTGTLRVTLVTQPNRGPAAARNAGAARARGSLLAFTDDDCMPDPQWLAALARHARERPGHLIGGVTANLLDGNPFSSASQHLVSYLYEYSFGHGCKSPRWRGFFASNNLAVPAEEFARMGGFDPDFPLAAGEDRDFSDRWAERNLPMLLAPDARVVHSHHLTASTFWRQHWNYGRGAFHYHLARSRRGAPPFHSEPLSFYRDLVLFPFGRETPWRGAQHAALLAVSQIANALGYLHESRRHPGSARNPDEPDAA
jgi:GT2 family glycosyltransferase